MDIEQTTPSEHPARFNYLATSPTQSTRPQTYNRSSRFSNDEVHRRLAQASMAASHSRPLDRNRQISSSGDTLFDHSDDHESAVNEKDVEAEKSQTQNNTTRSRASSISSRSANQTDMSSHSIADRDIEKQEEQPDKSGQGHEDSDKKQEKDPNLVEFDGPDDPANPQNFPKFKKWYITLIVSCTTLTITFASSVFASAAVPVSQEFDVGEVTATLGVSLFVLGFSFGPLIWGPFSELYGRKIPLLVGFFLFAVFQIPVAVAQNIYTIMICRFFGGVFGCAPLTVVGGLLADIWDPIERGVAMALFGGATFVGPTAGPIVGGFVTQSYLGWRWTAWLTLILAGLTGSLALIFVPETYAPTLHQRKATRLRYETKNWALHSKMDENKLDMKSLVTKYVLRPVTMLFLEPILVLVTLYMSLIYGIIYLFFESYPISFQQERGWNEGVGSLPFIGLALGVVFAGITVAIMTKTRFQRKFKESGGKPLPDERLPGMFVGAILLPIGLFWFAWTSNPNIIWVPQVLASIPIGMGIMMVFMQGLNYIIDVYLMNANSAIAANTIMRSFFGAGFPVFASAMYHNLGVPWATSLLGFLTLAFVPVPWLFWVYGARIRKLSKFVPQM